MIMLGLFSFSLEVILSTQNKQIEEYLKSREFGSTTNLQKDSNKYYLSICAIFRDEARFLREWIEFHILLGVEHFYLLNNLSSDDYQSVLDPYMKKGIVDLYQWNYTVQDCGDWFALQDASYNKIIKEYGHETKWLAIIDIDEFLFPVKQDNLQQFLKEYEEFSGVVVNYRMFGTSNIERIPEDKLSIETLIFRAQNDYHQHKTIKSIVQPKYIKFMYAHTGDFFPSYYSVTENKERFRGSAWRSSCSVDKIRINHYWTRDEDFFCNVKIPRDAKTETGRSNEKMLRWKEEFNKEQDFEIFRFIEPLKNQMAQTITTSG